MYEHGEGHVISHHSKCFSLPRVPVWWYIHSQLCRGYHYSLTIDSVRALLIDTQGFFACSNSARTY